MSILDPEAMFGVVDGKTLSKLAALPAEAKRLLQAALESLKAR